MEASLLWCNTSSTASNSKLSIRASSLCTKYRTATTQDTLGTVINKSPGRKVTITQIELSRSDIVSDTELDASQLMISREKLHKLENISGFTWKVNRWSADYTCDLIPANHIYVDSRNFLKISWSININQRRASDDRLYQIQWVSIRAWERDYIW